MELTFDTLGLDERIVNALTEMGIVHPTEIQQIAIPKLISEENDFIGLAQTGTGKTCAFGAPLLQQIDRSAKYTQALVIAPTRELVQQIYKELLAFSKYSRVKVDVVFGGASISTQISSIKKNTPQIIVATPGRLIDLVKRKVVNLSKIKYVVLDEADEMLNMGFQDEIDTILEHTPEDKKTWLFSATMPQEIRRMVSKYMHSPEEVSVNTTKRMNVNIHHKYMLVNRRDKVEVLKRLLDFIPDIYALIFCRTRRDTQELALALGSDGYPAEPIHGDLSQKQRDDVMEKFRKKAVKVLVATDVAARGIDVTELTHVIHFDLPDSFAYYTHRSGRTARAGKEGTSLMLMTPSTMGKMRHMARTLNIEVDRILAPNYSELIESRIDKWVSKVESVQSDDVPLELKERSVELFDDISKSDLIAKLLHLELKKIQKKAHAKDLNIEERADRRRDRGDRDDRRGGRDSRDRGDRRGRSERDERSSRSDRDDRRDRGDRDDRRDKGRKSDRKEHRKGKSRGDKPARIFINIGKMDKMSKGDLLSFVSSNANIKRKSVGDIDMHKRHSVLEVDSKVASDVIQSLQNASYNGRSLRVNKD